MQFVREGCTVCAQCAQACPNEALQLCGKNWTTEQLFAEIEKDAEYFAQSGGGVTFSGGECLLQPDEVAALLQRCRKKGIHTAVESACNVPFESIEKVYRQVDLFLLDIKHADSDIHRELTGVGNEQILSNIRELSYKHPSIWIRIPLIPHANDDDDNLQKIGHLIHGFGSGIQRVELLKYNNMASNKYAALGKKMEKFSEESQTDQIMTDKCRCLQEAMDRPEIPVTFA